MSSCTQSNSQDSTKQSKKNSTKSVKSRVEDVIKMVKERDPEQKEYQQAVEEVAQSLIPLFEQDQHYLDMFEQILEPERIIMFRVPWVDDAGNYHVNRGYRVQYSQTLGPYKGGLRFADTVSLSVMKFLSFEQTFKNALTGLPLGGGKGGSDFNPKGKSETEIMRFCQSFMTGLYHHIGPFTDIPAGDVGVGPREIGYMFGMYRRLSERFNAAMTGKGTAWGGSVLRPDSTGYGIVYFLEHMLSDKQEQISGKRIVLSGAGNVSLHAASKLYELGAKVITLSDSNGTLLFKDGITETQLEQIRELKQQKRMRLRDFSQECDSNGVEYKDNTQPWGCTQCDVAIPCATENEIDEKAAKKLVDNGVSYVIEGANMPLTNEAHRVFAEKNIAVAPAKAANAGGVIVSTFEMSQNNTWEVWSEKDVDKKLRNVMYSIYQRCKEGASKINRKDDLVAGANVAAFLRVAEGVSAQGPI